MVEPPASAMSHSPFRRLWHAVWTARSEDEHADWTLMLGPFRLSSYDTRVPRKFWSLPVWRTSQAPTDSITWRFGSRLCIRYSAPPDEANTPTGPSNRSPT